jgi:hypothetical protein
MNDNTELQAKIEQSEKSQLEKVLNAAVDKGLRQELIILFFLCFCGHGVHAQYQDTIMFKNENVIPCDITLVNDQNIFYTYTNEKNKISKTHANQETIISYSKNGKIFSKVDFKSEILFDTTAMRINYDSIFSQSKHFYAELYISEYPFTNKVGVMVDFGNLESYFKDNTLKRDKFGYTYFDSKIDALNYFGMQGWQVVEQIIKTADNKTKISEYRFLLKRDINY